MQLRHLVLGLCFFVLAVSSGFGQERVEHRGAELNLVAVYALLERPDETRGGPFQVEDPDEGDDVDTSARGYLSPVGITRFPLDSPDRTVV